jgi:K+-transporting ATPase ATPase A chain
MVAVLVLIFPAVVLAFTGVGAVTSWGTATLNNAGPHGFSEILYAFTSQGANNGSAFAGLGANTGFYNSAGGFAMFLGRYLIIIPMLAVAGSLARKQTVPPSLGTFPPALALGPIVEHFMGNAGRTF